MGPELSKKDKGYTHSLLRKEIRDAESESYIADTRGGSIQLNLVKARIAEEYTKQVELADGAIVEPKNGSPHGAGY